MARNRIDFDATRGAGFIRRVISRFSRRYEDRLNDAIDDGARTGTHDVMDDWKRQATDLAPLKTGDLRRGIETDVTHNGKTWTGEITSTAVTMRGGRRFDYATYLHDTYPEKYGDTFKNPTTDGTIPRYLAVPAEENEAEWARMFEAEIKAAIKRRRL
jgi:hypothetical protein